MDSEATHNMSPLKKGMRNLHSLRSKIYMGENSNLEIHGVVDLEESIRDHVDLSFSQKCCMFQGCNIIFFQYMKFASSFSILSLMQTNSLSRRNS